jgi:lipopolysaccharide export system protein LptC
VTHPAAPPELHLPDLPEVSVSLPHPVAPQRAAGVVKLSWGYRLQLLLSSYLPLLLMALLAASTWWLVKNTPAPDAPVGSAAPRSEPDYQMSGFAITRFAKDGQIRARIEGDTLRHFPDVDRIEIDTVRLQSQGASGRSTRATARQALANGDASEVQLLGGARVQVDSPGSAPLVLESEFLHAWQATEKLASHLPVRVQRGGNEVRAGGFTADLLNQRIELRPPVRMSWLPRGAAPKP